VQSIQTLYNSVHKAAIVKF